MKGKDQYNRKKKIHNRKKKNKQKKVKNKQQIERKTVQMLELKQGKQNKKIFLYPSKYIVFI